MKRLKETVRAVFCPAGSSNSFRTSFDNEGYAGAYSSLEKAEDHIVAEFFTQGKIAQIAEQFERTNGSVYSPLVKPGLIDEEEVQDAA